MPGDDLPDPDTLAPGLRLVPGSSSAAIRARPPGPRTVPRGDLLALARSFPTLADVDVGHFEGRGPSTVGFRADDGAEAFATWARVHGGGGRDAALFVLSVWNSSTDWREVAGLSRDDGPTGGRFDVHRALGNWDERHRGAFLAWAANPWWL